MIELNITPKPFNWPDRGGVREHLRLLYKEASTHSQVELVNAGGLQHVESAYSTSSGKVDVYVCHGGFVPRPMRVVYENLHRARIIISVSRWIADKFFPQYLNKTVVIHNGVDCDEWAVFDNAPIPSGYVLYAKEWPYYFDDFHRLTQMFPEERFVSTVWPAGLAKPDNVTVIGVMAQEQLKPYLANAVALVLTGPEVCPTMLLEAWACGVPVIAQNDTPTGAAELMLSQGRVWGGVLYTQDSLGISFKYCLAEHVMLGTEGIMELMARFQWKDQFEKYVQVYERLQESGSIKAA